MMALSFILSNPWARLASAVVLTGFLAFSFGFVKGNGFANAKYWQEQARAAKEAAATKERLAKEDAARAETAELALAESQAQLGELINAAKPDACKLSADQLKRLRDIAAGKRGRS